MIQRLFFVFFLGLTALIIFQTSLKRTSGDFDVYYNSSQHYLNKEPVYIAHGGIDEFKYSPLFALLFSPLTLLKPATAIYMWTWLNIGFLYAIFYLFYKLKQISFDQPKDFLIIVFLFALTGRYILTDFRLGQVNVLLCFLMLLTMYLEINKKYFWAGVILAFSLMIKFFPLLFVLYFLIKRRFELLAIMSLALVFFLLLPSIYSGFNLNLRYLQDWFNLLKTTPAVILYSFKNNSLLAFFSWNMIVKYHIHNVFDYLYVNKPLTPGVYYAWVASCLFFFIAFYHDSISTKSTDRDWTQVYLDYSCLFVCALLFNPLAYLNALTFLIVPYFFILRALFYKTIPQKIVLASVLVLLLCFVLTIMDNSFFFKNRNQLYDFLALKPLMWIIIFVYIILRVFKTSLRLKS